MKRIKETLLVTLLLLVVWEGLVKIKLVNAVLLPPPSKITAALFDLGSSGVLLKDVSASLTRVVAGLCLGITVGMSVGFITGRKKSLGKMISPFIQALRPLPPVALIPLFIVWFGIGNGAKILMIAFAVFFPVWVSTHIGANTIPRVHVWSAKLMEATKRELLLKVIIPATLPHSISGIRIGIAYAFIMVFVSELAGASSGIGYRISVSHLSYQIDAMLASLLVLGLCGALTDQLFNKIINRFFPFLQKTHE